MKHKRSIGTLSCSPPYGKEVSLALQELLWPTRCVICDEPHTLLCRRCRNHLAYLDYWRACPHCGAAYGMIQCCECDSSLLKKRGITTLPFEGCVSATTFGEESACLVRTWKDAGERRLAPLLAQIMKPTIPPEWLNNRPALVPIPASKRAKRQRGFDHLEDLCIHLSKSLKLPLVTLFAQPRTKDQRGLTKEERFENMQGVIRVAPQQKCPQNIIIVDDVFTTGATLFSASLAARASGAETIHCLTFARV